VKPFVAVRVTI